MTTERQQHQKPLAPLKALMQRGYLQTITFRTQASSFLFTRLVKMRPRYDPRRKHPTRFALR